MIDLKKTLFLLCSSTLAFTACGDDGGSGADAAVPDATPEPDAGPDFTFSGTLSLSEVTVTNPGEEMQGALVTVSYTDPTTVTQDPEPGYENNVGACRIFVYDLTASEAAAPGAQGGPVTVTGTNAGDFLCTFGTSSYTCSSTDAAANGTLPTGSVHDGNGPGDDPELTITGADFSAVNYVGMHVTVDGFPDAEANGTFAILGLNGNDTLVLHNPALGNGTTSTLAADNAYTTRVGGLIPTATPAVDFLDDGTNDVNFSKAEITNVPAVDNTITANGQGFALAAGSAVPHAVPTDGSEVEFSCAGSCGTAKGLLKGIILFGETTDGDITGLDFNAMPDPVSSYATFQCSGISQESISLDTGAMALLLGTNPTRIQTNVNYSNAQLSGANTIVVSHGVMGWTDVE